MDLDIQFGDLEEARPQAHLRPDRNKHYAVVDFETPQEQDLPIFVDLDAMRDMESHAFSDTRVELGGVLLGGQYEDEHGNPFVVVTDSLRAQHYQATKGSFKFTHETWEEITRQRDHFPDDLQMVGWYHTHPDWGVFLSGMDMFICDNFFNKPLDVALVIDPCRGDRGMFQWTGEPVQRVRRTGGFRLMASRFRRQELERFVAQLEGRMEMTTNPKEAGFSAPVVNIVEQRNNWQNLAVMGMMTMQLLVLLLIAWRLLAPPPAPPTIAQQPSRQIAQLQQRLDELVESDRVDRRLEAQIEVLDRVIQGANGQPGGVVSELARQQQEIDDLNRDLSAYRAAERQHVDENERLSRELQHAQQDARRTQLAADERISRLTDQLDRSQREVRRRREEIAALDEKLKTLDLEAANTADGDGRNGRSDAGDQSGAVGSDGPQRWLIWAIGLGVVLLIGGAVAGVAVRNKEHGKKHDDQTENSANGGANQALPPEEM